MKNNKHHQLRSGINRKVSVLRIIIIIPGLCKSKTTMKKETKIKKKRRRMEQMITELHQDGETDQ